MGNFAAILLKIHSYHTHTRPFYGSVRDYPGEPVPEETSIHSHPSCSSTILIIFLHLPRTIASSLLNPRIWQYFCTTYNHVLFGLPLGLEPTTSYSIHFTVISIPKIIIPRQWLYSWNGIEHLVASVLSVVCIVKGKQLELLTPNLVDLKSMAEPHCSLTMSSKGQTFSSSLALALHQVNKLATRADAHSTWRPRRLAL